MIGLNFNQTHHSCLQLYYTDCTLSREVQSLDLRLTICHNGSRVDHASKLVPPSVILHPCRWYFRPSPPSSYLLAGFYSFYPRLSSCSFIPLAVSTCFPIVSVLLSTRCQIKTECVRGVPPYILGWSNKPMFEGWWRRWEGMGLPISVMNINITRSSANLMI